MIRILGIDPGSRVTGYGVVETDGRRSSHLASGCVRTGEGPLSERLKIIFNGVREIVELYQPQEFAIEKVFVQRNVDSALKLGQARGAAICAVVDFPIPVYEYAPNQIKQAVVGKGHAEKLQVQHMVKMMLGLPELPASDAADALAVAICHGHVRQTLSRFKQGVVTAGAHE